MIIITTVAKSCQPNYFCSFGFDEAANKESILVKWKLVCWKERNRSRKWCYRLYQIMFLVEEAPFMTKAKTKSTSNQQKNVCPGLYFSTPFILFTLHVCSFQQLKFLIVDWIDCFEVAQESYFIVTIMNKFNSWIVNFFFFLILFISFHFISFKNKRNLVHDFF